MRAVVAGATGQIGSRTVDRLRDRGVEIGGSSIAESPRVPLVRFLPSARIETRRIRSRPSPL